jgi:hypothetical protein
MRELVVKLRDLSSLLRSAFIPTTAQDALVTDEAADALEAALLRISELEGENERLKQLATHCRAASKSRGRDLLREEADAALPAFRGEWEPLRDVAMRAGAQSASWLVSRARDLQERGLVESKWFGKDRHASFKVWRAVLSPLGG